MKKLLQLLLLTGVATVAFAQTAEHSPFLKSGYTKPIVYTASYGLFEEFHDLSDTVEIGDILFDCKNNKIVGFLEEEEVRVDLIPLSIDPHAARYWWVTPYAYCNNNPLRFIDPNGKEIYEFDEMGKYLGMKGETGSPDQLRIIKSDGSTVTSKEYANGTITSMETITETLPTGRQDYMGKDIKKDFTTTMLGINGDNNAKELYDDMRNNTGVEWSCVRIGDEGSDKNIIGCTEKVPGYNVGRTNVLVFERGENIREDRHSHINRIDPGKNDLWHAGRVNEKFPDANLYIDFGKSNIQYNKNGIVR